MSSKSAERFHALREQSRARLVAAAVVVFARHGYEGASVRAIAQEAGVAQGLLYNYFASKEELLRAVFDRGMGDVQQSFADAEAGAATPGERLAGLIRHAFAAVRDNLDFWRLSYGLRFQPAVAASLDGDIRAWSAAIRARLADLLREAGVDDPATEAALLFAQIDGAAQHFALDPDAYPLDRIADRLAARYAPPVVGPDRPPASS